MTESTLTIKFKGAQGDILDELVRRGYFKTKSEAVRAATLLLGEKFGVLSLEGLRQSILKDVARRGRSRSDREMMAELQLIEDST